MADNIREIPYNYTSYSDREIVIRFLGEESWDDLNVLRSQRRTGRSARMLFEILGDLWMVERNIYLKNTLLQQPRKRRAMQQRHASRLQRIIEGATDNPRARKVAGQLEQALEAFAQWFEREPQRRKQAEKAFARHTHRNNVHFDAYTLAHHATDATDWRSHLPFCVLTPDAAEEIPGLIRAAKALDLVLIPRGGGTGLCGGSVPLTDRAVIINLEKLDVIDDVRMQSICDDEGDESAHMVPTIRAGAGAITGRVMEAAQPHVFATDPTSLWACTIGGNVASNAGGKHAVIWGTCLDNLLAWRMIDAEGNWLDIRRLNHNMGKIHDEAEVQFRIRRTDSQSSAVLADEILTIPGGEFRRQGLGKDVTRKAMRGLPGIQKEGCDGLVVEATFVLHKAFAFTRTVCCEFFGRDLAPATAALVAIKEQLDALPDAHIEGFEHFDEKYIKAIDYVSRSTRREHPRMVLLIDISGDDEHAVAEGAALVTRLTSQGNGEGFVAVQQQDRHAFWADRSRMAAIARHTRAFKLNEDVVIPLPRLHEYSDFIERLNIEASIDNKIAIIEAVEAFIETLRQQLQSDDAHLRETLGIADDSYLPEKLNECELLLSAVRMGWMSIRRGLDLPAAQLGMLLQDVDYDPDETVLRLIQRGGLRISYREEIEKPLLDRFRGHEVLCQRLRDIHQHVLSSRIVVATHMHAGDGNVHTNIPVNSNDYAMMKQAHHTVELIMRKAVELGGVISGEHGIGITKLPYLGEQELNEVAAYLRQADPEHRFNPGKLIPDTSLALTYTPSFNLLEHEAVILEAAEMTELTDVISPCLRCGKCKPVCNTHFPRANMLYSPRNKIQASGAMIEAFLYESQTGENISFEQFSGMAEIADHCTICHKCEKPCPVNIDFGRVSERMRAVLKAHGQRRSNLGTRLSLGFLSLRQDAAVKVMRKALIDGGYTAHRWLHKIAQRLGLLNQHTQQRRNLEGIPAQVISFVERPLKQAPTATARTMLGIESRSKNMIPVLRQPAIRSSRAVFYFPGCGSERLYSQIALATEFMLYELGVHVVLPPSYVCCGYPSSANGDTEQGQRMVYDNRVMLHRLKNALSYLDFEAVVVSCGTCFDQLEEYHLQDVFPDAPLIDIHEYLTEQGIALEAAGRRYVYHEPCHTPLKRHGSAQAVATLLGAEAIASAQCCGEAGTMAVSSPAIAGRIRMRKEEELQRNAEAMQDTTEKKILTSCPSCLQGLGRLEQQSGLQADYMVVELVRQLHGDKWQNIAIERIRQQGVEYVLM